MLLFFAVIPCKAQLDALKFTRYTIRDGLLSSHINEIVQDKDGFLWIASNSGLNRFNGYDFEDMTAILGRPKPIIIASLMCDSKGRIWIGTEQSGIFVFDPRNYSIVNYTKENAACRLGDNFIKDLFEDSRGRIWVSTWFGLHRFNEQEQTFSAFPFGTVESKQIFNYNVIEVITEAPDGRLWLGTWGGGLHVFDPQQETFRHFESFAPGSSNKNVWVRDLNFDNSGRLWIATVGEGLWELDPRTYALRRYDFFPKLNSEGHRRLLSLYRRSNDELWIGSEDGLIRFNTRSGKYDLTKDNGQGSGFLMDKYVHRIFEDNHKGIWINAGGLNYFNYGASKFQLIRKNELPGAISDNEIYSFFEYRPGEIWVSTQQGINVFNTATRQFSYRRLFDAPVHKMLKNAQGEIIAISPRNGMYIYQPATGRQIKFDESADLRRGLLHHYPLDAELDAQGNLWIGSPIGLSCRRASDGLFFHITDSIPYSGGLSSLTVPKIAKDDKDSLWIINDRSLVKLEFFHPALLKAGGPAGIISDTTLYRFKRHYKSQSLRDMYFAKGTFWLIQNGLAAYDPVTGQCKSFTHDNGLASNAVRTVVHDDHKGLWIATDNGVSYLNVQTLEITNFYEEDGLQGNNFSKWAILKSSSGEVYFGGNNGFNIVKPGEIELNPYIPPVKISGFRVFNEPVPVLSPGMKPPGKSDLFLSRDIAYLDDIRLSYRHNTITFEFAALNFLYPEQNQYAYLLEGVDQDWNYIKNRRYASFSNLPQGQWLTLKVKAGNNNGIWNTQETRLRIFIEPPFWNTAWFRWTAALALALSLILAYRLRVQQLKTQKRKLELIVERRTRTVQLQKQEIEAQNLALQHQSAQLRKIDEAKTRFYSNVSHEFRTPLSLIVGPSEELLKDTSLPVKALEYLRIISQNGKRLLRLVTQIMDIGKLEDGVLQLEVAKGDIIQAVNAIAESFHFMAEQKQIAFSIRHQVQEVKGYFDRDKIEKIVYNLLHNAFKYTDNGRSIWLETHTALTQKGYEQITIEVKDSGIGIPQEELEHIFEQYYRVQNQYAQRQFGAGIGLSLVKKLIELHKGSIAVQSEEHKGSTFSVSIPLLREHYSPKEIFEEFIQNPDAALQLAEQDDQALLSSPLLPAGEKRKTILLVEDNPGLLLFLKNVLWEHFDIIDAANGVEGWEKTLRDKPDLVISDVMMPGKNGIELCAQIKKNTETAHIPVILLTAKTAPADRLQGLQAQADAYLSKPVDMPLLLLEIKNLITAREMLKERYKSPLSSHVDARSEKQAGQDFMYKVFKILEDNISNENLDIEFVRQELGISRTLLYEKVKAATGDSLNKLIKNYRLQYAAKLLLEEHLNASELAYRVGFSDPKYFSKCFLKHYGMTPKTYLREKLKSSAASRE